MADSDPKHVVGSTRTQRDRVRIDADELVTQRRVPSTTWRLIDHLVEAGHRRPLSPRAGTPTRRRVPHVELFRRAASTPLALRNRRHKRGGRRFELVLDVHHAVGRGVHGTALVTCTW